MSPLTCSLLALAALFTVVTSVMVDPYPPCNSLSLGNIDTNIDDSVDFKMPPRQGRLTIPDKCSQLGRKLVGETINACDEDDLAPSIYEVWDPTLPLKEVDLKCRSGCSKKLEIKVTQYCQMVAQRQG